MMAPGITSVLLLLLLHLRGADAFAGLLNVSSAAACSAASDVCSCSELAPGCGWCSSSQSCRPAAECTTTCRECPSSHKSCRSSCRRRCINTCALMTTVCGCAELDGCGWCTHGATKCQPYPECSTTCEECDSSCANYKYCRKKCFTRFRGAHASFQPDNQLPGHQHTLLGVLGLRSQDGPTAAAAFAATTLASAAGIGGGALLVPIYTLVGKFTEHEAIPLSKATIFGSSAYTVFGSALWQRHPLAPWRPLVVWSLAEVLIPPMLLGVTAGVFLNTLCPNWLIMVLAACMCLLTGMRTLRQARQKWEEESKLGSQEMPVADISLERRHGSAGPEELDDADLLADPVLGGSPAGMAGRGRAPREREEEEEEPEEGERAALVTPPPPVPTVDGPVEPALPLGTIGAVLRAWLLVLLLGLLKGGHGAPSLLGLRCGSGAYWGVVLLNLPVLGGLTWLAARALLRRQAQQQQHGGGGPAVKGDVRWDAEGVRYWGGFICVMSLGAGMLGLGGGQIIKPVFNELGLLQQVSSATAALMMLFMSSTTVTQFLLFGALEPRFAVFYGGVGCLGSVLGNRAAKTILLRTGRPSLGIFLLAFLLLGSGVFMVAGGAPRLMHTGLTAFRPLCGRVGAAARSID